MEEYAKRLDYISFPKSSVRHYPKGALAAHLIGVLGMVDGNVCGKDARSPIPAAAPRSFHMLNFGAPKLRDHAHTHDLHVPGRDAQTIALETALLGKNQALAERNRGWLAGRGVLALNLMSSPGAGKTTLLERCIRDLHGQVAISVVEGDQATVFDAERIRATGAPAVQVNTGTGCHLEADMLGRALELLQPARGSLLVVENVGNLVCPALFDLGENARVVIFSVTEGEDKPLKYPHMFSTADVLLLSKTDLLPHLRVDLQRMMDNALAVNPRLKIIPVSAYTGEGLDAWYGWLRGQLATLAATR